MSLKQDEGGVLIERIDQQTGSDLRSQVAGIAAIADEIWREHYIPLIGEAQVSYMLAKFQSAAQIYTDITENGYIYFTAKDTKQDQLVGYCAVAPADGYMLLSKIYVRRDFRGNGAARRFLDEAIALCSSGDVFDRIRLTVNKHNDGSIAAYRKMGFNTVDSVKTDIGCGFYMDDYVMELALLL